MAKRMIAEVDGNSSKAEELETLSKIVTLAKPGSYLHSFFTDRVKGGLRWAILNDWSCNLYDDLIDHDHSVMAELQLAKKRIAYLEQQVDEHQHTYSRLNDIIEGLQGTINNVRRVVNSR